MLQGTLQSTGKDMNSQYSASLCVSTRYQRTFPYGSPTVSLCFVLVLILIFALPDKLYLANLEASNYLVVPALFFLLFFLFFLIQVWELLILLFYL